MASIDEVRKALRKLRDELIPLYVQKVEDAEAFDPLCVVLWEDGQEDFLYLEYESMQERREVFDEMNEYLKQDRILGCVFIIDTAYTKETGSEELDAIYTSINGFGIKEIVARPFRVVGSDIEWLEKVGPSRGEKDGFVTAFSEKVH